MTEDGVLELARAIAAVPGPESFNGGAVQRQAHIQVILNEALGVGGAKPTIPPAEAAAAWANAVRAEWSAYVEANPELKAMHAVAVALMVDDGYGMEPEPICSVPGQKPPIAMVDGKEAICFDWGIAQAFPLSAIYVDKVRTVQSAAARVAKALTDAAVKAPPEWPVRIATGETFNSIEEMEQSPINAVQEMAKAMRGVHQP